MAKHQKTYTIQEASKIIGISRNIINQWVLNGFCHADEEEPYGGKVRKRFSYHNLFELLVVRILGSHYKVRFEVIRDSLKRLKHLKVTARDNPPALVLAIDNLTEEKTGVGERIEPQAVFYNKGFFWGETEIEGIENYDPQELLKTSLGGIYLNVNKIKEELEKRISERG